MDSRPESKPAEEENAQHLQKVRQDHLPLKEDGSVVCGLVEVDQKEDESLVQFVEKLSEECLQEELGENFNESIDLDEEIAANSSEQLTPLSSVDQDSLVRDVHDILSTDSGAQSLSIFPDTSEEETTEGESQSSVSEARLFDQEVLSFESFRRKCIQGELGPSVDESASLMVEAISDIIPAAISQRSSQNKEKPLTISQSTKERETPSSTVKLSAGEDLGEPNDSLQPSSDIHQSSIPQSSTSESKVSRQEIISPEKPRSVGAVEEELHCCPNNGSGSVRWENPGVGFIQDDVQSLGFSISKEDHDKLPDKEIGDNQEIAASCKKRDKCCQASNPFDNSKQEVIILKKKTAIMAKDAEAMENLLEDVRKDYEQLQKNFEKRESELKRLEEDKTLIEELKKENRWMKKEKDDLKLKLRKKEEKVAEMEDKHQSVYSKYLLLKAERDSFLKDRKTTETLLTEIQRHLLKSDEYNKESKREVVALESSSITENMPKNFEPSRDANVSESWRAFFAQNIQQVVVSVKDDLQNTIRITSQDSAAQYKNIDKELRKLRNEYCYSLKTKDSEIQFLEDMVHGLQSKIQSRESEIATLISQISSADKDKQKLKDQIRGLESEILEAKSANGKIKADLDRMRCCLKRSCTAEEFEELDRFDFELPQADVCCSDNTNDQHNILDLRRKVTKLIALLTRAKKIILKLKHEQQTGKEWLEEKVSEAVEKERRARLRLNDALSRAEGDQKKIKEVNAQLVAAKVENTKLEAVKTELEKSLDVARERHGAELQSINNTIKMLNERLELAKAQIEHLREKNSHINRDRLRLKRRLGNERAGAHAREVITADSTSDESSMPGDGQDMSFVEYELVDARKQGEFYQHELNRKRLHLKETMTQSKLKAEFSRIQIENEDLKEEISDNKTLIRQLMSNKKGYLKLIKRLRQENSFLKDSCNISREKRDPESAELDYDRNASKGLKVRFDKNRRDEKSDDTDDEESWSLDQTFPAHTGNEQNSQNEKDKYVKYGGSTFYV